MPGVLADLDEVLVGTLFGEHPNLFDLRKLARPFARLQGCLYRALRKRADGPTLEIRVANARRRNLGIEPHSQDRSDLLTPAGELLNETQPAGERPHRSL